MRSISLAAPGQIRYLSEPGKPPGKSEVLIRFIQGGICGSDVAAYLGTSPLVTYPRVIGHEVVGQVVTTGADATAWQNSRVVVEPLINCGACYACRLGRYNTCENLQVLGVHADGGFRDEFVMPAARVHGVPPGMSPDAAVLVEPVAIACQAVFRAGVAPGEKVLIFGAGPIGLLALQIVTSYIGASAVVADVRTDRLAMAARLGAAAAVNVAGWPGPGASPALLEQVRSWSGGDMAHVVIEATGHPAATAAGIACLAHTGRLVWLGWNKEPIIVDTVQLMRKEANVYGSRNSCDMFGKAIEIVAGGHIDVQAMITHRFSFASAAEAFAVATDAGSGALKIVLTR